MSIRAERAARAAGVVLVLLGLLAIVALTSGRDRPRVAGGTDAGAVAGVRDLVLTVGGTLYVITLLVGIWAFWKYRGGGRGTGPSTNPLWFLMFTMLAATVYWGIHNRPVPQVQDPNERVYGATLPQVEAQSGQRPGREELPPAQFRWDVAAGLVVALVAIAGAVIVLSRRKGDEDLEPLSARERAAAELASIVEGTLDDLRREADPRRAVIAAYAQMEVALARHGLPRERSEAPFEYLGRMLRELRVRAASALALTELFERARFSDHVIDAGMKDEAIDALVAVRDDLRLA